MPTRWLAPSAFAAFVALAAVVAVLLPAGVGLAAPEPTVPVSTLNDFIPTDRDLSECISALPPPGCGSEARSDWRQVTLLCVLAAGLAFIAWRIVRAVRRGPARPPTGATGSTRPNERPRSGGE